VWAGTFSPTTAIDLETYQNAEPSEMIQAAPQNRQPVTTVLVSRPGIMQQSLRSSLAACRGIAVVGSSGDGLTALGQVTKLRPGLLVIDSNLLDQEVEALIAAAKSAQPAIFCLVLVRSSHRETQVLALGADAAARRDGSAQQLQSVLARLSQTPIGLQCE